ncbi:hypothetical protein COY07_04495 [Candidatus Peregrinibacteria bacterium CG_4_10_14_0_2_um_filter_43_11]|nr:MAG: hypothetical protein COY07_04495 [Candidatus Peregrinibacteria bacterium CG_4_10_14_0_2_um_filter_43_11]
MKFFLTILLVFIIVDVAIVAYVIYRRITKKLPKKVVEKIRKTWKEIIRQKDYERAIMEADKLLDFALEKRGMKGSLGAKLKQASSLFSDVSEVWSSHKIRNNIAHQINYKVDQKTYKKAMLGFKRAFKDLKIF